MAPSASPSLIAETIRARRELPPPGMRKALRESVGVSLAEIRDELEHRFGISVTKQSIYLWESGRRTPRPAALRAYAEILRLFREAGGAA
jgi:DNA-binding transcriptional regulator YiaG